MLIHPEQKEDEIFIGNSSKTILESQGFFKFRQGLQPYDINGDKITDTDWFHPIFVKKEHHYDYDKFANERTFDQKYPYTREQFNKRLGYKITSTK